MLRANSTHNITQRISLKPDERVRRVLEFEDRILERLTSDEAEQVALGMVRIYFRMANSPAHWERQGTLRLVEGLEGGRKVTPWEQLAALCSASVPTVRRAVLWMHEQGILTHLNDAEGSGFQIRFALDEEGRFTLREE